MTIFDLKKKNKEKIEPRIKVGAGLGLDKQGFISRCFLQKNFKKDSLIKNSAGFTLVEALAIIVIIGFLAAIIIVNTAESRKRGQDSAVISGLREIRSAAELHNNENETYEGVCDDVNTTLSNDGDFGRIKAYIEENNGHTGVIGCQDAEHGFAVISSLNIGNCWCVDYQGASREIVLPDGQTCNQLLTGITCP